MGDVDRAGRTYHRRNLTQGIVPVQRRIKHRPHLVIGHGGDCLCPNLRREIHQGIFAQALHIERRRLGWKRLGLRQFFARNDGSRHWQFFDRPDRFAGFPIKGVDQALLGRLHDDRGRSLICHHIQQYWRRRRVEIPDVMVHQLIMPGPFASAGMESDQGCAVEVVAGMVATIVVDGDAVGGNVDQAQFQIRRDRGPGRDIAGILPGIIFPGFVPVFAGLGDDVEFPQEFTGRGIVTQHVAGHIFDARLVITLFGGITHHHHAIDDDGW